MWGSTHSGRAGARGRGWARPPRRRARRPPAPRGSRASSTHLCSPSARARPPAGSGPPGAGWLAAAVYSSVSPWRARTRSPGRGWLFAAAATTATSGSTGFRYRVRRGQLEPRRERDETRGGTGTARAGGEGTHSEKGGDQPGTPGGPEGEFSTPARGLSPCSHTPRTSLSCHHCAPRVLYLAFSN